MGKRSREKGAAAERTLAAILRPLFPDVRRRCAGEESQGNRGRDLENTPGLCVQSCHGAHPPALRKLREAEGAARVDETAIAFVKADREPWTVVMRMDAWLRLERHVRATEARVRQLEAELAKT